MSRLITKFGTKGLINLGKMLPGIGTIVGGAFDFTETKVIASRAYKWFFEEDFSREEREDMDVAETDNVDWEMQ